MWFELVSAPDSETVADDQTAFLRRARRAAEQLGLASRPTLSTWRQSLQRDDGILLIAVGARRYVYVADTVGRGAAEALAYAADATVRPSEGPMLPSRLRFAHAIVPRGATLSRVGRDDLESGLDMRLDVPEGRVVALNVRRMGFVETRRVKNWLGDEFNMSPDTSKLQEPGVGVVRVMAGAPAWGEANRLAENAANALDLGLTPGMGSHSSHPGMGLVWISFMVTLIMLLSAMYANIPWWLCMLSILPLVGAIVRRVRLPGDAALDQRPRHRWWRARFRTAQANDFKTRMSGDDQTVDRKHRMHAYALHRSSMPIPSATLAAFARPPLTAGAAAASLSDCPDSLIDVSGPLLGFDATDKPVCVPEQVTWGGIMLFGEPGKGKSNSLHGVEAWMAAHDRSGDVLIVFEAKGHDGVPVLRRLIPSVRVVDVADATTPMISLTGGGSPMVRAERFADLMRGALGDVSFGYRSRAQTRDAVFLAFTWMNVPVEQRVKACGTVGIPMPVDWLDATFILLTGRGVSVARGLAHAIRLTADSPQVAQTVENLHGGMSESGRPRIPDGQLQSNLSAPVNKIGLLAACPMLHGRREVSWAQILSHGTRLVVNLGAPIRGGEGLPEATRVLVGALLFQSLGRQVESSCAGWQDVGRHCRVFIDELTDVLGVGENRMPGNVNILELMRSRYRAMGVEVAAGTQYPEQLDERTLALVLGFTTVGVFSLRAPMSAQRLGDALGVSPGLVSSLGLHELCVRTVDARQSNLPALTIRVPHFDAGDALVGV